MDIYIFFHYNFKSHHQDSEGQFIHPLSVHLINQRIKSTQEKYKTVPINQIYILIFFNIC